jgi:hypothetical protein
LKELLLATSLTHSFDDVDGRHCSSLSNQDKNKKRRGRKIRSHINVALLLAAIFILSPMTVGNLYGRFSAPNNTPIVKSFDIKSAEGSMETFTVNVKVYEAVHVYGWQANILFDPSKLAVLEIKAGDFLADKSIVFDSVSGEISGTQLRDAKIGDAMLCFATDIRPNLVLAFGCCWGDVTGVSGSGTVAKITFGVLSNAQGPHYLDLGDPVLVNKQGEVMSEGWLAMEQS